MACREMSSADDFKMFYCVIKVFVFEVASSAYEPI